MNPLSIALLTIIVLFGLFAIVIFIRTPKNAPSTMQCVHCKAPDPILVDRQMLDSRTVHNYGGGSMAGGDVRVQIDYDVTYRCKACHKTFQRRQTETS